MSEGIKLESPTDSLSGLPPVPLFAFEVIDSSCDETYHPLGLYLALTEAIEAASCSPEEWGSMGTPEDEDYAKIVIKQRALGEWDQWGGVEVWSQSWSRDYNEETDEYEWSSSAPEVKANEKAVQPRERE